MAGSPAPRRRRRTLAVGFAVGVMVTTAVPAATTGFQDGRIEEAAKLIQQGSYGEAIRRLDAVIEGDPDSWAAHYQRGRALGLQGQMAEALPSLLRAAELNPGMAHAHELAAIAAWEVGDRTVAWDQVILAHLAGADETARIRAMAAVEGPPEDFMERITAPRVVVAPFDLQEIETRAETPFNRNPLAREDQSVSGVPDEVAGRERVTEAYADLARVQQVFRDSILASRLYGLTLDLSQAEYVLRIAVDELGERPPRRMAGYLELIAAESGVSAYRRAFELRQIEALGELHAQIGLLIDDLETWLRKLRESESIRR